METTSQTLGVLGEELAGNFLSCQGYKILLKNYECVFGEVDIIAKEKGELVFIEVKTRQSLSMGHPAESVTPQKQQQIIRVAKAFISKYGVQNTPCRFDVVSIIMLSGQSPKIEIIKSAFEEKV